MMMVIDIDIDIDIYRCVCFSPLGWRLFSVSFDIRELLKLFEINQVFQGVALVVKGLKRINVDKPLKTRACKYVYICVYLCLSTYLFIYIVHSTIIGMILCIPRSKRMGQNILRNAHQILEASGGHLRLLEISRMHWEWFSNIPRRMRRFDGHRVF